VIALTDRDRALIRAAWSLGLATHETLRMLVSPQTRANTLRRRLGQLHRHGYLTQTRHVGPGGCIWLYGVGARGLTPGEPRPWRPSLAQLEHTLTVGDVLVALTRSGFASPLVVTGWQGESEVRAWATPGTPFPDARVTWGAEDARGVWLVEVDRATESHAAWRRKLVRYVTARPSGTVLAITTSTARARGLATVASEIGLQLLATSLTETLLTPNPTVFDASLRRRCALANASTEGS